MAHGTPDWGVTAGRVMVYSLTDLAEAVVRIGSVDSFDRRGSVLFLEDFESSLLKWTTATAGVGSLVQHSLARSRSGLFSCRLFSALVAASTATLTHIAPLPPGPLIGLEVSFSPAAAINILELMMLYRDSQGDHDFRVRLDGVNALLQYFDSGLVWQNIATGIVLDVDPTLFHTLKLVGDVANDRYVRVIFDQTVYLMTNVPVGVAAPDAIRQLLLRCQAQGSAARASDLYLDDIIVTQDEPVAGFTPAGAGAQIQAQSSGGP